MARKSKRVSRLHPRKTKSSNKRTKKPRSSKKPYTHKKTKRSLSSKKSYTHKKRKSLKKMMGGGEADNFKKKTTTRKLYNYKIKNR